MPVRKRRTASPSAAKTAEHRDASERQRPESPSSTTKETRSFVAMPALVKTSSAKLYKPVPMYYRKRLVILYGMVIGVVLACILGIIDSAKIIETVDVLDKYVKNSHEALAESRKLMFSSMNYYETLQLRKLMDFTPPSTNSTYNNLERPGETLAAAGLKPKHPVVMVPGIVTTGLELWQGEECAKKYFRQRMWGTMTMVHNILLNTRCWIKHMALNASSGLDQQGIKLRAAQGFEAADFVLGGYWVWAKLIENLADIGYDPGSMHLAGFDWRLGFKGLETRDQYMSKLTRTIEGMVKSTGEKAVIVSHSMGGNLVLYFFQWVAEHRYDDWVEEHIETFVSIATPFLGTPKGVSALLSGEAKDTAEMGVMGSVLDHHISPLERRKLFRSWESTLTMIPKGGNRIWGGGEFKAVDFENERLAEIAQHIIHFEGQFNMTAEESIEYLLKNTTTTADIDGNLQRYIESYTHGFRLKPFTGAKGDVEESAWLNLLEHQLPTAPSMKIYCLYGVGKEAERAYFYAPAPGFMYNVSVNTTVSMQNEVTWQIDKNKNCENISIGIIKSDGDGSVPLLSLGLASELAWKLKHFNPSGIKVVTREYKHSPASLLQDVRGGPATADHVDIMGNHELMGDVVRVAAGVLVEEKIFSNIREMAAKIPLPPELV